MARQEQQAAAGACEGEPAAVVQRTQVLLLAGEPWGPDGGQRALSSLAQHVLPSTGDAAAADLAEPPVAGRGAVAVRGAPQSGQLTFFLCRAASLRERPERLREALRGVREQGRGTTAALVGVLVQPRPDEEPEALRLLEQLLRDTFLDAAPAGPELHTAVFAPGRPGGALELRRLDLPVSAPRSVGKLWLDRSLVMQMLGAMLSFGTVAYGSYYLYNNPPV